MAINDTKYEVIRDQAISKVHWGASKDEVVDWLMKEQHFSEKDAADLWRLAWKKRSAAIRIRALLTLFFSLLGFLSAIWFFLLQRMGHFVILGWMPIVVAGFGLFCLFWTAKSLARLVTGSGIGPVD